MKTYFSERLLHLEETLRQANLTDDTPTPEKCDDALEILLSYKREFHQKLQQSSFSSAEEEIYFFRHQHPILISSIIYYLKLYHIELRRPIGSDDGLREFYRKELLRIDRFFIDNEVFIQYLRSGSTVLDNVFFLRHNISHKTVKDSCYFLLDPMYTTNYDLKAGKLQACVRLSTYLNSRLADLTADLSTASADVSLRTKLTKTGDVVLEDEYLIPEILERVKVSERTLYRWRKSGELAYSKVGGTIYIRLSDVREVFERYRHNVSRDP